MIQTAAEKFSPEAPEKAFQMARSDEGQAGGPIFDDGAKTTDADAGSKERGVTGGEDGGSAMDYDQGGTPSTATAMQRSAKWSSATKIVDGKPITEVKLPKATATGGAVATSLEPTHQIVGDKHVAAEAAKGASSSSLVQAAPQKSEEVSEGGNKPSPLTKIVLTHHLDDTDYWENDPITWKSFLHERTTRTFAQLKSEAATAIAKITDANWSKIQAKTISVLGHAHPHGMRLKNYWATLVDLATIVQGYEGCAGATPGAILLTVLCEKALEVSVPRGTAEKDDVPSVFLLRLNPETYEHTIECDGGRKAATAKGQSKKRGKGSGEQASTYSTSQHQCTYGNDEKQNRGRKR